MTTVKSKALVSASSKAVAYELPIINTQEDLMVDARLLHQRLGVNIRFNDWIQRRIAEYHFVEGKDFYSNLSKSTGGRKATEYHFTLDTAKELAMVERTPAGRSIRQYFIAAEKELHSKRLYAATATLTELNKTIKHTNINGRKLYPLRQVRLALGFNPNSSTSGIHKRYAGLAVMCDNRLYVAEEYVRVMMSRAKTRALTQEAQHAKPVLPANFGQMTLNLKGGRA